MAMLNNQILHWILPVEMLCCHQRGAWVGIAGTASCRSTPELSNLRTNAFSIVKIWPYHTISLYSSLYLNFERKGTCTAVHRPRALQQVSSSRDHSSQHSIMRENPSFLHITSHHIISYSILSCHIAS